MNYRIGGLSYLNTRPLVYGLEDRITPGEPARMADALRAGELDAAIVPVAEVLRDDRYAVVDGIAIASRGPVRSVFVAHRANVRRLKRIAVTPASRTSVWLLRVLLQQVHGIAPELYPKPPQALLCDHEAMLLIGDEALEYSLQPASPRRRIWDLGEAWQSLTGLPFVYAVWALPRKSSVEGRELSAMLRAAKAAGLAHLRELADRPGVGTPQFRYEYLTQNVCYDLGAAEKAGLRKFQELCCAMGLVKETHELRFVS